MRSRDTLVRLHRFRKEEKKRQVEDIETMILDLTKKHDDLDYQVRLEEQRTGVTDPSHFNYSMSAKAARGRRDNLLRSIAELRDKLASAQASLAEEEAELRKIELLVEKEAGHAQPHPTAAGSAAAVYPR
jgi:flagellar protein FliJ